MVYVVWLCVFIGEMSGVGITTMSGRMGHADPSFTLRTYSPYLESADALSADAIGKTFDTNMRLAELDTSRYKLDTELQKTPETKGDETVRNATVIELNATTQRETLEATPGIEIHENSHPQSRQSLNSHFITRVQRPTSRLSPVFPMSVHGVVPNPYQLCF
jgi:hypothetical protein